jgi:hypothetical protein
MVVSSNATRVTLSVTAAADGPFRLADKDLYYYDLTVWCLSNDAYMGDGTVMDAPLSTSQVYYDRNGNLADLYFKNKVAGSNCKIVAIATVPNELVKQSLSMEG